jgi:hypothetical protein
VVSALLLITLLLVLALYLHRRRQKAERKLDEMRVVFNNLQENAINDESFHHQVALENAYCKGSASNIRKAKKTKKTQNFREDDMQGRNLLSISCMSDEDYDFMDHNHKETDTTLKYFEPEYARVYGSRRSSGAKAAKYALARSKDSQLDSAYEWDESDITPPEHLSPIPVVPPAVPPRRGKPIRARSGVWDNRMEVRTPPPQRMIPSKRLITMSAPDLIASVEESMRPQIMVELKDICGETSTMRRERMTRSSTIGAVQSHRTYRPRSKSNSRLNKC